MTATIAGNGKLGLNGLGRIGKLALWFNVASRRYDGIVVNVGRGVGTSLDDLCHYLSHDSTYGRLGPFLHGFGAPEAVRVVDADRGLLDVDGVAVTVLTRDRNPKDIAWREHDVRVVVDATGAFTDPTLPADAPGGSLRGHLEAGARVVVQTSPFKIKDPTRGLPEDAVTLIQGINHGAFDPVVHRVVSAASCTTTGLGHLVLPLLEHDLTRHMLTASMSTIHAATNTQAVLDQLPRAGATDLRKTRSTLNNIILTSTNAAAALERVIPDIRRVGFLADSVRVPVPTASLIILNATFQSALDGAGNSVVDRSLINRIYRDAERVGDGGVRFSERQNVSTDMVGEPSAIVVEGHETHTRTGFIDVHVGDLPGFPPDTEVLAVPVTHAKIFGWYDNELGSFTRRMSQLAAGLAERMA